MIVGVIVIDYMGDPEPEAKKEQAAKELEKKKEEYLRYQEHLRLQIIPVERNKR